MDSDPTVHAKPKPVDFETAWKLFDATDTGVIQKSQVALVLRAMGYSPSERELQDFNANVFSSNQVTKQEFLGLASRLAREDAHSTANAIQQVLGAYDRDKTGMLAAADLKAILSTMGDRLTKEEADTILDMLPKTDRGMVKIQDVIQFLTTA